MGLNFLLFLKGRITLLDNIFSITTPWGLGVIIIPAGVYIDFSFTTHNVLCLAGFLRVCVASFIFQKFFRQV